MTRKDTLERLLKYNKIFASTYHNIFNWNADCTRIDNLDALGIASQNGYKLAQAYHLPYTKGNKRKDYQRVSKETRDKYAKKWKHNLTIKQNAKILGVSELKCRGLARRYQFPYLKITGRTSRIAAYKSRIQEKIIKMRLLRTLGFNNNQIGSIMGISRERVRQLV